jgi:hypothetical protein
MIKKIQTKDNRQSGYSRNMKEKTLT